MDSTLLQLGVGGIFAIMIIRFFVEMLKTLKTKTANGDGAGKTESENKIDALFEWHSQKDHDGVPLWYFPRSYAECQKEIVKTQEKMAESMRETTRIQTEMSQTLRDISNKIGR